jgi:ribosomal protein S18 acetylase RimI-like enzyme
MHAIVEYSDALHRASVIALWNAVFDHPTEHRQPSRSIDMKLAHGDRLFFVALAGDKVVGTVLAGYDGHRGWLYSVSVDPGQRRQGIGEALVHHAETALVQLGCLKINLQVLNTNTEIVPFYESLGYSVEHHVSMGKRLYERLD